MPDGGVASKGASILASITDTNAPSHVVPCPHMGIGSVASIQELRQSLGYQLHGVARLAKIHGDRLRTIEAQPAELLHWEAERLAKIYGVDPDLLSEPRFHVPHDEAIRALACADRFQEIGDSVRQQAVACANACRDIVRLKELLGLPCPEISKVPQIPLPGRTEPYQDGRLIAEQVRRTYGMGVKPIHQCATGCQTLFQVFRSCTRTLATTGRLD